MPGHWHGAESHATGLFSALAIAVVLASCQAAPEGSVPTSGTRVLWRAGGPTESGGLWLTRRPVAAAIGTDGNIAVLDAAGARVVLLDSAGVVQATFGERGSGPGHFVQPSDLGFLCRDTALWVSDRSTGRLTVFDLAGEAPGVRTLTRPFEPVEGTEWNVQGQWLLGSGAVLGRARRVASASKRSTGAVKPLAVWKPESEDPTVIDWIPADVPSEIRIPTSLGPPMSTYQFIRAAPMIGVEPCGAWIYMLDRSPAGPGTAAVRITRYTPGGDRLDSVRIRYTPLPVDESVHRWLEEIGKAYERQTRAGPARVKAEDVVAAAWVPEFLPPVRAALPDADGFWLQRERVYEPNSTATWERYDLTGTLIHRIELPNSMHGLAGRGDRLLMGTVDSLGVAGIEFHQVVR